MGPSCVSGSVLGALGIEVNANCPPALRGLKSSRGEGSSIQAILMQGKSSFSATRGGTPDARKFKEETQNGEGEAGGHSGGSFREKRYLKWGLGE